MVWTESIWLAIAIAGAVCGGGWPFLLFAVNVGVLTLFGYDKRAAIRRRARIPERELLFWTALGGSAGAMVGILLFRHKSEKRGVSEWVVLLFVVHCVALACLA